MRQQLAIVDALKTKKWGDHPISQKLTIFDAWINSIDMNPKKPTSRKSKSAGISLEPDLIKRSKEFAEKNGFGSLSNWVRFLLTQELSRAEGKASYTLAENPGKTSCLSGVDDAIAEPNATAPNAQRSSVSYRQKKTDRQ